MKSKNIFSIIKTYLKRDWDRANRIEQAISRERENAQNILFRGNFLR
jgi:hypothetical protein